MNTKPGFAPLLILAGIALVALIGGSGSYYLVKQDKNEIEVSKQAEIEAAKTEAETLPAVTTGLKTVEEIRALAEPLAGRAKIISIELENEDAGLIYKVKLSDGKALFFNAKTGAQITDPSDDDTDVAEDKAKTEETDEIPDKFIAKVTLAEARLIAEARRPGKAVKKIELEMEEGVGVYSVRFTDSGRVDVNATTGAIMRVEAGDDEDSDEDSQEDSGDDKDDQNDD